MRALDLLPVLLLACDAGDDASTDDDTTGETDPGEDALAGLYEVTSDASSDDCGDWVEAELPLPYFRIEPVAETLEFWNCRTRTDCDEFALDDDHAFALQNDTWRALRTWTYWQDDSDACIFNARRTTLKPKGDGGNVVVESTATTAAGQVSGGGALDDEACAELMDEQWEPSFSTDTYECWKIEGKPVE